MDRSQPTTATPGPGMSTATVDEECELDDDLSHGRRQPRTGQQRVRRWINTHHTATQTGLLELVSEALGAKVAHDVDCYSLTVDRLDAFTTAAASLRAAVVTEHDAIQEAERTENP